MEAAGLIKLLIAGGFIKTEETEAILKGAKENEGKDSFLSYLIKTKKLNSLSIADYISQKLSLPYFDIEFLNIDNIPAPPAFDPKLVEKFKILPLKLTPKRIFLLSSDPTNHTIDKEITVKYGVGDIQQIIVEDDKLQTAINRYIQTKTTSSITEKINEDMEVLSIEDEETQQSSADTSTEEVDDAPVVKFIQSMLMNALKRKASDLHFEPYEKFYRIRYRVDGVLEEIQRIPTALKEKIASRIKVISKLDISEKRIPQDGRFKLKISADRSIDFRVSTCPTLYGEKIVMRILDSSPSNLNIDALGYSDPQKKMILDAVSRPYGMVLVTGPTGSGKTVSLYTCINILNQDDINISTAEDPAEINLPGVNQVNVNEKAGLTFAAALKSFLRQDPDIVMIGEIRDLETADIAIKAAQTGHLVLSTLHTNDAPTTLTRMMNMGVAPFNIASSVILITAQRLARRLCNSCKKVDVLPEDTLLQAGFPPEDIATYNTSWKTYKAVGCPECSGKGYKGRVGIYQVMPITEEIQRIILSQGTALDIAQAARKDGVLTLREAGLEKVKLGVTSLTEVEAVTNA